MREPSSSDVKLDVWCEWILEAIRKIRSQKQRPSIQRICQAIGTHHKFHEDIVAGKLEEAVQTGKVIKVYIKGLHSYKAPQARLRLTISPSTDLSWLLAKAVRDLGECAGSNVHSIETYLERSSQIELTPGTDFHAVVKASLAAALSKRYLVLDGKLYKVGIMGQTARRSTAESPRKRSGGGGGGGGSSANVSANVEEDSSSVSCIFRLPKPIIYFAHRIENGSQ